MRDKAEPEKKTSSIDINLLLDFYGPLLAERQRQTVEMYYGDDMTLSEIASELGISRQAAQQSIRKGCGQLEEFERKLGLCGRFAAAEDPIRELRRSAEVLANRETAESEAVSEAGRVYEYLDSLEKLIWPVWHGKRLSGRYGSFSRKLQLSGTRRKLLDLTEKRNDFWKSGIKII